MAVSAAARIFLLITLCNYGFAAEDSCYTFTAFPGKTASNFTNMTETVTPEDCMHQCHNETFCVGYEIRDGECFHGLNATTDDLEDAESSFLYLRDNNTVPCPADFLKCTLPVLRETHACYWFSNDSLSWDEAIESCGNGTIAVVDSETVNNHLSEYSSTGHWIGLKSVVLGVFLWTNGKGLHWTNWKDDSFETVDVALNISHCVANNVTWEIDDCNTTRPYICKAIPEEFYCNSTTDTSCPEVNMTRPDLNVTLSEVQKSATWEDAVASCKAMGMRLLVDGVGGNRTGTEDSLSYWIGLSSLKSPGSFHWLDGAVPTVEIFETSPYNGSCAFASNQSDFFSATNCSDELEYFCEYITDDRCFTVHCNGDHNCFSSDGQNFTCNCSDGYSGDLCEDFDPCEALKCQNNGTCEVEKSGNATCNCTDGYEGIYCDKSVDPCEGFECQNGGECESEKGSPKCKCTNGFEGLKCEKRVDPCEGFECQNGGECESEKDSAKCTCIDGFEGLNCEKNIDDCAQVECQNDGACVDEVNSFRCECKEGYEGDNCEIEISESSESSEEGKGKGKGKGKGHSDEKMAELEEKKRELEEKKRAAETKKKELEEKKRQAEEKKKALEEKKKKAEEKKALLESMKSGKPKKKDITELLKNRKPKGCDLDNLPDSISPEVKEKITALKTAESGTIMESLAGIVKEVDAICFKSLKEFLEGKTLDCSATVAKDGICNAEGDKKKIEMFTGCLAEGDKCDTLKSVLGDVTCVKSHIKQIRTDRVSCGTTGMSPLEILSQDTRVLTPLFANTNDDDKKSFLLEVATDHSAVLKHLPCKSLEYFRDMALDLLTTNAAALKYTENAFWETTLLAFLPYMEPAICETIDPENVVANVANVKALDFLCEKKEEEEINTEDAEDANAILLVKIKEMGKRGGKCHYTCGKTLIKKLLQLKQTTTDVSTEANIESMDNLKTCQTFADLVATASPGQCESFNADVLKASGVADKTMAMTQLAGKCKLDTPAVSDWTAENLRSMGCLVVVLAEEIKSDITSATFCEQAYFDSLGPCMDVLGQFSGSVMEICKENIDVSSALESVGTSAVLALGTESLVSAFSNMTLSPNLTSALADGLADMDEGQKTLLAFTLAQNMKPEDKLSHPEFASVMSLEELGEVLDEYSAEHIIESMDISGLQVMQVNAVVNQYLNEENITSGSEFTATVIEFLDRLVEGLSTELVGGIEEKQTLEEACKTNALKGTQIDKVAENLLFSLLDIGAENPLDSLDEDAIYAMQSGCFKLLTAEHLNAAARDTRHALCNIMGAHPRIACLLDHEQRHLFAEICVDSTDVDEGDTVYNYVENSGALLSYVEPDGFESISGEQLLAVLPKLHPVACMHITTRTKLFEKLEEAVQADDFASQETLEMLGDLAYSIHTSKQDQQVGAEALVNFVTPEHLKDNDDFKANLKCCVGEMNETAHTGADEYMSSIGAAQLRVLTTVATGEKRRKRSIRQKRAAATLTCIQVTDLDKSQLVEDHIENMANAEFLSCFEKKVFGSYVEFSDDMEKKILEKLLSVRNQDNCALNTEDQENLGSIADQLPPDNTGILCLQNFSPSTMLGQYSKYSEKQLEEFAKLYTGAVSIAGGADITQQHIVTMQNFACGLSPEWIKNIPNEVFGKVTSVVGKLTLCPQAALDAWAEKARDFFGAVADWTPAQFGESGIIIAGLTAEELNTADAASVELMSPLGISMISGEVFKDLGPTLLGSMDSEQILSIETDQFDALEAGAQEELNSVVAEAAAAEEAEAQLAAELEAAEEAVASVEEAEAAAEKEFESVQFLRDVGIEESNETTQAPTSAKTVAPTTQRSTQASTTKAPVTTQAATTREQTESEEADEGGIWTTKKQEDDTSDDSAGVSVSSVMSLVLVSPLLILLLQ